MHKILLTISMRTVLLAGVAALFLAGLSLRAGEPQTTLASGGIDLKVDSEASYNGEPVSSATWGLKNLVPGVDKFFNFSDIKPGDHGENTISLHIKKESAWVCLDFLNLKSKENDINEPESETDSGEPGELAEGVMFFAWHDDGDNIFEKGEKKIFGPAPASEALAGKTYPIADSKNGPAILKNNTKYFGIYWCAGELEVDMVDATLTCNGEALGNEAQTDSFSVDVRLRAASAKSEPKFQCSKLKIPDIPPGEECKEPVKIEINNDATVVNSQSSSANTGGNTGGNAETGDSTASTSITNIINSVRIRR